MSEKNSLQGETPDEYRGLHRILLFVAGFFFVYLILESVFLIPTLFVRYGFH